MSGNVKLDNTTLQRKASLRLSLRKKLRAPPVLLETHGGLGLVWDLVYSDCLRGVVCETDPVKAAHLAWQRPTWSVYESPAEIVLAAGAGAHLPVNLLDIDPYGEPWPVIEAFFGSVREFAPVLGIAVNDGLRQHLKLRKAWSVQSMAEAVRKFGNHAVSEHYLEVARWNLERLCAPVGYRLTEWTAYFCGHNGDMTHFAAVLELG